MTQPSFEERATRMRETAESLHAAADIVLAEAQHMDAARARFAERKSGARKAGR
jgi:hypothetical protein